MRWALYSEDQLLLRGKVIDISRGGVLLGELSLLPRAKSLRIIFELPLYHDFSKVNWNNSIWGAQQPQVEILSAEINIVRSFSSEDALSALFQNIGAEWVNPEASLLAKIDDYVALYKTNLRYILSLFETAQKNSSINQHLILFLSSLLGMERGLSLAHLRTKLMHRYQSVSQL